MYCKCGCGEVTSIAKQSNSIKRHVKGRHVHYKVGHGGRVNERYKLDKVSGCWIWLLSQKVPGYGSDGNRLAHVVSYERKYGPVPAGKVLDHLCRNPICINPDHLEPVTRAVNNRRGANTRLTYSDVQCIRFLGFFGFKHRVIAEVYGVVRCHISKIIRGDLWKEE